MTQEAVELRILSGVHRGAVVPLPGEAVAWSLGHAADNDVILRDAPFARATLRGESGGWRWNLDGDPGSTSEPVDWPVGAGLRVGHLAMVLSRSDSGWSEPSALGWVIDQAPPSSTRTPVQTEDAVVTDDEALAVPGLTASEAPSAQGEIAPHVSAGAVSRRPRAVVWGALGMVVLGLSVWGLFAVLTDSEESIAGAAGKRSSGGVASPAASASSAVDLADAALRSAVQQAVDALQVAGSIRVLPYTSGKAQLSGVVDSDETAEAVVRAASKVTTSLKMSLLSQAEFALRVQALKGSVPEELTLRALPWGRVEVSGTVADQATKDNVRSLLLEELPMAMGIDMKVLTTQEFEAQEAKAAEGKKLKMPPIAAVVSGPRPYLVLADGRKILPGGVVGSVRLTDIEPSAVVFENEAGVQFRMAR